MIYATQNTWYAVVDRAILEYLLICALTEGNMRRCRTFDASGRQTDRRGGPGTQFRDSLRLGQHP